MKITHVGHDFNNFLIIESGDEKVEIFVDSTPFLPEAPKFTGWDFKFRIKNKEGQEIQPTPCCGP